MGLLDTQNRYNGLIVNIGQRLLNVLFPNDIEFYSVAFELVTSTGEVVDFFTFPVMPNSINESQPALTNIKKTAGGITAIKTSTFTPIEISMEGTFGRKFKALIRGKELSFAGLRFSSTRGIMKRHQMSLTQSKQIKIPFNPAIKTGYGCLKILESMFDKAQGLDELGGPMSLYFYNPALGNNYLVEPKMISFKQQTPDSNTIWRYQLEMVAIAPLEQLSSFNPSRLATTLTIDGLQESAQKLVNRIDIL